jgi:hypothetical protein
MVEFALVFPVFLLVVFATIDYGGYFGSRLSVENAARSGARVAVWEPLDRTDPGDFSTQATVIVDTITSHANVELVPNDVACTWQGTTLSPTQYPPFTIPVTTPASTACIGLWYFELADAGPPWLCGSWSVASGGGWSWYDSSGSSLSSPDPDCVVAGKDLVVVGVGYQYSPYTPLPSIAAGALTTYGETQLLEEQ